MRNTMFRDSVFCGGTIGFFEIKNRCLFLSDPQNTQNCGKVGEIAKKNSIKVGTYGSNLGALYIYLEWENIN